jgi:hypothetical protein
MRHFFFACHLASLLHERIDFSHPDPSSGPRLICIENAQMILDELATKRISVAVEHDGGPEGECMATMNAKLKA